MNLRATISALAAIATLVATQAWAINAPTPRELQGVDVEERLGERLPLDLTFTRHDGETERVGDWFDGRRPVLITLNYYSCPMLCGLQLNALHDSLTDLDWTAGENFRIVTISVDPDETSELANQKRDAYLDELGRGDDVDWSFYTGNQAEITALADALGYRYHYVEETGEYAHPAVLMFASPNGDIMRYIYGLTYETRDVRFALLEASQGRVGTTVDRLILGCYIYDPNSGSYVQDAFMWMRIGATSGFVLLSGLLVALWRRERHRNVQEAPRG